MPLTVAVLREKLTNSAGEEFRLAPGELGIPEADALFTAHLGDPALAISGAQTDPEHLTVAGKLSLLHLTELLPASVSFLPEGGDLEDDSATVTGVQVDVALPDGPIPEGHLAADPAALRDLGFDVLHLLLDVSPDGLGTTRARVGLGAELPLPGRSAQSDGKAYVSGFPPDSASVAWNVSGEFPPVALHSLSDLGFLAPGAGANGFQVPEIFSNGAELSVTGLSVNFADGPGGKVYSAWVRVDLDTSWEVFPGLFEISGLRAEFAVLPRPGGLKVSAQFGGLLTLAEDVKLSAAVRVPELGVVAELVEEVSLEPLLELFLPGSGLPAGDLSVHRLRFEAARGQSGPVYGLDMGIGGAWQITDGIALSGMELSVLVDGKQTEGLVAANWLLGSGSLRISAERRDNVWKFAGTAYGVTAADLFGVFGTDPPAILDDLELASLHAAFDVPLKNIGLSTTLAFPLGDADCALTLTASLTRQGAGSGYEKDISGVLRLTLPAPDTGEGDALALRDHLLGTEQPGPRVLEFAVIYDESASGATVTASWTARPGVALTDLVAALGMELPSLPEVLQPELESLGIRYDTTTKRVILTAATEHTGWVFVTQPGAVPGAPRTNLTAVRVDLDARASHLPLVGESIPPGSDLVLDGIAFTSTPLGWTPPQAVALNAALDLLDSGAERRLPRFAADATAGPGTAVQIELAVGGVRQAPLVLPITTGTGRTPAAAIEGPRAEPAAPGDGASRDLELAFGPVRLNGLTLGFANGTVFVAIDAVFTTGPVQFALLGLGIGIDAQMRPVPVLRGAALLLEKPPLRVVGALERRTGTGYKELITGALAVETGFFSLKAVGSYARSQDGWSSVFLFGEAGAAGGAALFGPPAFQVRGLSAGFGVNSTVRTPAVTQIPDFPLIGRLAGGPDGTKPEEMLDRLIGAPGQVGWVTPHPDRYWAAVGIDFTSFKFIDTRALALVEFGDALKVMILGRTSLTFPKNADAGRKVHARINIDLKLAYVSAESLLSLDIAVAEGSFVFDPAMQLTGGIAVYVWTGGQRAGDFVISIGGYHPAYRKPAHYPTPARLGFVWSPDDNLRVSAQGYTALTPNALMLGGKLDARYDKGILSAWFTAYLDALIQWNPFRLELSLGIRIGVAFTIKVWFVKVRVSIEVGINLDLWTPPLGGRVTVKVWFISFSFSFGAGRPPVPPIGWGEFRQQLPELLAITPERGTLPDVDAAELAARSAAEAPELVSGFGFTFTTRAAVPVTKAFVNDVKVYDGKQVDVRPMGEERITSEHRVKLYRNGRPFDDWQDYGWTATAVEQGVPGALWRKGKPGPGDSDLLPDHLIGLRFDVPKPAEGDKVGPITSAALDVERLDDGKVPLRHAGVDGPAPEENNDSVGIITRTLIATKDDRTAVHCALAFLGVAPGGPEGDADGPLDHWAVQAGSSLTSPPLTAPATR
ncbi:hypothetical protein EKH77_26910 [Streptomyces luteoverticillatus]|uniref:DUF6603 domain-containing protein n=1 Tax=Streptomyces luteoverticillatus TaxID=66425 RepID=A0A3S9PPV1_STRLT|nr:DUF6603 domain-containing protein [Streptomyces luteoverticillatus]AZQ74357.1 hypothetical protein EKH77_26910 [Streptomyces luteoverticillatus]